MEQFIKTGCSLLDARLGGGYALRRMVHIYGDASTGKTQLAIEAVVNFLRAYPNGRVLYCDAEAAFDEDYAAVLGMPRATEDDRISFMQPPEDKKPKKSKKDAKKGEETPANSVDEPNKKEDVKVKATQVITVEYFGEKANEFIDTLPADVPGLLILDSYDSLPMEDELENPEVSGYGTEKSKLIGIQLRVITQKMQKKDVCFMAISQTRQNVSGYGEKTQFSGGNALKFYASQRIRLKHVEKITKSVDSVEHIIGVKVDAYINKNKCAAPFKGCEYNILFNYGIDDVRSCLDWLKQVKMLKLLPEALIATDKKGAGGIQDNVNVIQERIKKIVDKKERRAMERQVCQIATDYYNSVEQRINESLPSGKYEDE